MKERILKSFEKSEALFYKHCGCKDGYQLKPHRNLEKLIPRLGYAEMKKEQNLLALGLRPESQIERRKAGILLTEVNFDINNKSMGVLKDYWYEDVELVQAALKAKRVSRENITILKIYNSIQFCVRQSLNFDG